MSTEKHGSITITKQSESGPGLVPDEHLYATKDGRLVEEGHPDAHELVAAAGQPISPFYIRRLGITAGKLPGKKAGAQSEPESAEGPDLDAMTKAELLEHAEKQGVDASESMTKAEIRAALGG